MLLKASPSDSDATGVKFSVSKIFQLHRSRAGSWYQHRAQALLLARLTQAVYAGEARWLRRRHEVDQWMETHVPTRSQRRRSR